MPKPWIYLLAMLSVLAACSSRIPRRGAEADASVPRADASLGAVDASVTSQSEVVISPHLALMRVGDTVALEAELFRGGNLVLSTNTAWVSADSLIAVVDAAGNITAMAPGTTQVQATVEGQVSTLRVDVFASLESCCQVASSQGADNFCSLEPGTPECPMTQAGGACDPNGDSSFADASATTLSAMAAFLSATCLEDVCSIAQAPNVLIDCSAEYEPNARAWRCVELTTVFPGVQASQVCQDLGAGPKWYTYNLTPEDCCECDGQTGPNGLVPDECVCSGTEYCD